MVVAANGERIDSAQALRNLEGLLPVDQQVRLELLRDGRRVTVSAVLKAQAKFIKLRPELSATIEGHADDAPLSSEENGRLSEARGEAVRKRLIEEGIESHRLAVVSWGRSRRVADCTDAACAAQNRRAVTVLQSAQPRNSYGPEGSTPRAPAVVSGQAEQLTH